MKKVVLWKTVLRRLEMRHLEMRHIDPHVHCRDDKEAYKADIREVSEKAQAQGIVAILDICPIFSEEDAKARISLAESRNPVIPYFFYMGLTANKEQIKEAVRIVKDYPQVVGLKMRTIDSPNFPGVSREKDQSQVYQILTELDYKGVLMVHCEKQSKLNPKLWDPLRPWTHSSAHPPGAEFASIWDQIWQAEEVGFKGQLHIAHISCPESVKLVARAKKVMAITCGVTPHHILWDSDRLKGGMGLFNKVDPPLRNIEKVLELRKCLIAGEIDWVESDYAPHTVPEKLTPPYLSGIAAYGLYQVLLDWLKQKGVTDEEVANLTYWNIKKVFGEKLEAI
ncbi:MAG: dihydroorotase family protein [Candidatus Nealsonbacteria bacterium]